MVASSKGAGGRVGQDGGLPTDGRALATATRRLGCAESVPPCHHHIVRRQVRPSIGGGGARLTHLQQRQHELGVERSSLDGHLLGVNVRAAGDQSGDHSLMPTIEHTHRHTYMHSDAQHIRVIPSRGGAPCSNAPKQAPESSEQRATAATDESPHSHTHLYHVRGSR